MKKIPSHSSHAPQTQQAQHLQRLQRNALQLPEPSLDARQASQALCGLIERDIQQNGGVIAFSRYMELALFAPELGYYSGGSTKLGAAGDFITAPELSPLFGSSLFQFAQNIFSQTDACILEFGAGTGKLAFDLLSQAQAQQKPIKQYFILELSSELRDRQKNLLKDFPCVTWLDTLPTTFSGLIIGNEVLDAMPVDVIHFTEHGWKSKGVSLAAHAHASPNHQGLFAWQDQPLPTGQAAYVAQHLPHHHEFNTYAIGYTTETHAIAYGFIQSIASMMNRSYSQGKNSAALWIDYGFPAMEYYLNQRNMGTLMCHYRHHAHPDPFYLPGLQDITAHVNFTAMAQASVDADVDLLHYGNQAGFLLANGITDIVARTSPDAHRAYLALTNAMNKLISPAEMGELFKVLILGKGITPFSECAALIELSALDKSHRL